jgi:tRNA threonylcarbamoyladenosine biosynthesis protein TsaB
VRASEQEVRTLELVPLAGRMYSAQLIPSLQQALTRQNLAKNDIDAFIVASGPGSFTGLRVGISTIKALSEVMRKPIVAVSVLEAAARATKPVGRVLVALDAGRKQVFVGDYDFQSGKRHESLVPWEEFFRSVTGSEVRIFSPDASVREAGASHGLMLEAAEAAQADVFARIGYEKLVAGETASAELLEANYIRASDAELFSLPKLTQ